MAALLVFLSLGVVLSTEALLRSTGANAERAEDRVLRRCIGARRTTAETTVKNRPRDRPRGLKTRTSWQREARIGSEQEE